MGAIYFQQRSPDGEGLTIATILRRVKVDVGSCRLALSHFDSHSRTMRIGIVPMIIRDSTLFPHSSTLALDGYAVHPLRACL